jgi:hypothetical protein
VRLKRRWWHGVGSGSVAPADERLDRTHASITRGARELACRLNQCSSSFAKTAENLQRAAHLSLSDERVRQVVEAEGKAVLRALESGALRPTWTAEQCCINGGKTRVYVGCDGVKIPVITEAEKQKRRQKVRQKRRRRCGRNAKPLSRAKVGADNSYKELRLAVFYDEAKEHCHVAVTRKNHEVAGRLLAREAGRLGLHRANEKIANVDGALWIRNQLDFHGLVDRVGLDFYHLSENVHKARRAVFGDEDSDGQRWAGQLMHRFKHQGYAAAWQQLTQWRVGLRRTKRKAADTLLHYVAERREMIRYPEFRRKGWQIGSGPTEAQCKTTTMRVKGSGKRWDADHAEELMALACLENSRGWQAYWHPAPSPAN